MKKQTLADRRREATGMHKAASAAHTTAKARPQTASDRAAEAHGMRAYELGRRHEAEAHALHQSTKAKRDEAAAGHRSNERPAHREAEARGMRKAMKAHKADDTWHPADESSDDAGGMMPDKGPRPTWIGEGGATGQPAPPFPHIPAGHGPE